MNEKIFSYPEVLVLTSPIHEKGIFLNCDVEAEERIMVINGEVIDEDECVRRENEEDNVYIFWNGDNYIDVKNEEKIKFINHHCDPNCYVSERNESSLYLVALRDIKKGEELTIDYGYPEIYEECQCSACK